MNKGNAFKIARRLVSERAELLQRLDASERIAAEAVKRSEEALAVLSELQAEHDRLLAEAANLKLEKNAATLKLESCLSQLEALRLALDACVQRGSELGKLNQALAERNSDLMAEANRTGRLLDEQSSKVQKFAKLFLDLPGVTTNLALDKVSMPAKEFGKLRGMCRTFLSSVQSATVKGSATT